MNAADNDKDNTPSEFFCGRCEDQGCTDCDGANLNDEPQSLMSKEEFKALNKDRLKRTKAERQAQIVQLVGEGKSRSEILGKVAYDWGCSRALVLEDVDQLLEAGRVTLNERAGWALPGAPRALKPERNIPKRGLRPRA